MGAAGTDAAIEAADIALMADDLGKLEEAIYIGRKARLVSRQNIVFSLIVLAVLIPAGVGGFITVAVAVLVHEVSELLAVANGLRSGAPPNTYQVISEQGYEIRLSTAPPRCYGKR